MNNAQAIEDLRRYPRKEFTRKIGILFAGDYRVVQGIELSEGGLSFSSELVYSVNRECVVTFKIPAGPFISLRAFTKHMKKIDGKIVVGVSFVMVPFSNRRQIRNFVADRNKKK